MATPHGNGAHIAGLEITGVATLGLDSRRFQVSYFSAAEFITTHPMVDVGMGAVGVDTMTVSTISSVTFRETWSSPPSPSSGLDSIPARNAAAGVVRYSVLVGVLCRIMP